MQKSAKANVQVMTSCATRDRILWAAELLLRGSRLRGGCSPATMTTMTPQGCPRVWRGEFGVRGVPNGWSPATTKTTTRRSAWLIRLPQSGVAGGPPPQQWQRQHKRDSIRRPYSGWVSSPARASSTRTWLHKVPANSRSPQNRIWRIVLEATHIHYGQIVLICEVWGAVHCSRSESYDCAAIPRQNTEH